MIEFPISGVETYWWLPIVFAFAVSCLTSTAGISGAFLLLPFQISFLGFSSPGVTPTNLLYNTVAIPSGIYRYYKERRLVWPLVTAISVGTIPGLFLGVFIRIRYLPDPRAFKFFIGLVLLYISVRLLASIIGKTAKSINSNSEFNVSRALFGFLYIEYEFNGQQYRISTWILFLVSIIIGTVGGIYGIGGGAIMAPILVTMFRLPIHTISGATLFGTFLTSTIGVVFYIYFAPVFSDGAISAQPDWFLGLMFGAGGSAGMYIGARLQKYLPSKTIKLILVVIMFIVAGKYLWEFITY